ncbi:hypothetical protein UT300005_14870 [Clostridium sp. CTA-5]
MNFKQIESLVSQAKDKNNLSKELLAKEFTPFILNLSKKTFIDGYDINDIQNECYRILFKCVEAYDIKKHRFVAYATIGIKNCINDLIKKGKNRSSSEGSEALILSDNLENVLTSDSPSLDEMFSNRSDYEELQKAVDTLNHEEKELILFVFFKNNSLRSYAYWKNMCYSTANYKKRALIQKLRSQLCF